MPQLDLYLCLDGRGLGPGRDASDQVEPLLFSELKKVAIGRCERRHQVDGQPKGGRRGAEALAVEAGRRNAYNGDRLAIDGEAGADDRRVASQFLLPGLEADDGGGRRALHIVGGPQQPSSIGAKAERCKRISGNEFTVPGLRGLIAAGAAHRHRMIGGFKGSEAGEARGVVAKLLVLRVGEQRPVIHRLGVLGKTSVPAALFVIAYAQQAGRILDRQRPEEHGVHQGEDGSSSPNAECEGKDGGEDKAG